MEHPFLVAAIVLVSFIALAQTKHSQSNKGHGHGRKGSGQSYKGHQSCYPPAQVGSVCGDGKRCLWNKKGCPHYGKCHLICTNNPYNLCYGASAGDGCGSGEGIECWPDHTGDLLCIDTDGICSLS